MSDKFDKIMNGGKEPDKLLYSRPEDEGKDYIWTRNGVTTKFRRVTSILEQAPGGFLMKWYGKQAALSAAAPLVHAGLLMRDAIEDSQGTDDLDDFVLAQAARELSEDEAIRLAGDWRHHMLEGERNRDSKGRIGSVTHHWLYDFGLGLRVVDGDLEDYCVERVRTMQLLPDDLVERYAAFGKTREGLERDIAKAATPYILSAHRWIERYQPEWEALGLESAVFNTDEEYAGTRDAVWTVYRKRWEALGERFPFNRVQATVVGDFKTSKSLNKMYDFQVAAYARADFVGIFHDQTEHEVEEVDGAIILHIKPDEESKIRVIGDDYEGAKTTKSGAEKLDDLFEGFCGLSAFYRRYHDMPKANRARKFSPPKIQKGQREPDF